MDVDVQWVAPEGPSVKLDGASFKPVVSSGVTTAMVSSSAAGAITPLKALTMRLVETYHTVNPSRQEQQVLRRVLTQPAKPAANGCVVSSNPCSRSTPSGALILPPWHLAAALTTNWVTSSWRRATRLSLPLGGPSRCSSIWDVALSGRC